MCYLDAEEITAILREPDRSSLEGQRDHALLAFLYLGKTLPKNS
jgi:site-specific recombinase XerD